jgi:hypothetical protein
MVGGLHLAMTDGEGRGDAAGFSTEQWKVSVGALGEFNEKDAVDKVECQTPPRGTGQDEVVHSLACSHAGGAV